MDLHSAKNSFVAGFYDLFCSINKSSGRVLAYGFYMEGIPVSDLLTGSIAYGKIAVVTRPNPKTLGDILFADKSKVGLPEDEWQGLIRAVASGDQRALHSIYEQTHRIVFTLIVR